MSTGASAPRTVHGGSGQVDSVDSYRTLRGTFTGDGESAMTQHAPRTTLSREIPARRSAQATERGTRGSKNDSSVSCSNGTRDRPRSYRARNVGKTYARVGSHVRLWNGTLRS